MGQFCYTIFVFWVMCRREWTLKNINDEYKNFRFMRKLGFIWKNALNMIQTIYFHPSRCATCNHAIDVFVPLFRLIYFYTYRHLICSFHLGEFVLLDDDLASLSITSQFLWCQLNFFSNKTLFYLNQFLFSTFFVIKSE